MSNNSINRSLARNVLNVVDKGLCSGLGEPVPGQMCVEAAVCFAMGLPHSDKPTCVESVVRSANIGLNDSNWSTNKARGKGMRRVAIAQLGSMGKVDPGKFVTLLSELTIRVIVPMSLRAVAKVIPSHSEALEAAAVACEKNGDKASANAARNAADAASNAADVARNAAHAADAASNAAIYATYAASNAANAAYAAAAANAADAARNAAYAARYAAYASYGDKAANAASYGDKVLAVAAELMVTILKKCGSPGCKWLDVVKLTKTQRRQFSFKANKKKS